MPPSPQFKRGARPSPRHALLAAAPHVVVEAPPPQWAFVPPHLDMWGNSAHGCCVTSEEAFAKACYIPEIFITEQTVIAWAQQHGVLEGASLTEVMDSFVRGDGFRVGVRAGIQEYGDGPHFGVNYADETVLRSAVSTGPVKIAIDADALPAGAGSQQGWFATGQGNWPNTDHCVSVCGYGSASWLYGQLGLPLPTGLTSGTMGYLVYTWATIGFVDYPWLLSTCAEAWVRNPTTVGVPPLQPSPQPGPGPTPGGPTKDDVLNAADRVLVAALNHTRPVCRPVVSALRNDVHRVLTALYAARGGASAQATLEQVALGLQIAREGIQAMRDRLEYALTDKP